MTFRPHKHKASDIVETQDDYLLPYLRSLRDPSKIERTIIEGSEPLPEGTAFPTEPYDDQFFRLTQDITGYPAALYRYDGEADEWIRLQPTRFVASSEPSGITFILGDSFLNTATGMEYKWTGSAWQRTTVQHTSGTTLPTSGMIEGDTFYRTTDKKTYFYDGAAWQDRATLSHDGLVDVGPSDHHTVFTDTQHAVLEHTAGMLNQAIQPYNSNITFARKSGQEDDGITYTSGEIKFQDGTARTITPAGELLDIPIGDNYIYFKTDSASLFQTTSHSEAISLGRGLLAIIIVVTKSDPDIPCAIQPFYAKGLNITADTMAVTVLSAITSYLGNVEIADGFILLGDSGIIVNEGDVIIDGTGVKIYGTGTAFKIYAEDETLVGYLGAPDNSILHLFSAADKGLAVKAGNRGLWVDYDGMALLYGTNIYLHAGSGKIYTYDSFRKHATIDDATIELGTPGGTFRYFTPTTTEANRPTAAAGIVGLIWTTREGAGEKSYVWQCAQNAGDTYEWVLLGETAMVRPTYETWQKSIANPIWSNADYTYSSLAPDNTAILRSPTGVPIQYDSKYWMAFSAINDGLGLAWSTDLINWTEAAGNPIIDIDDVGAESWEKERIAPCDFIYMHGETGHGEDFWLFYKGMNAAKTQVKIGIVHTNNMSSWTRDTAHNPIVAWMPSWIGNVKGIEDFRLQKMSDGNWMALYEADQSPTGGAAIGAAYTPDVLPNSGWIEKGQVMSTVPDGGDFVANPTVIRIDFGGETYYYAYYEWSDAGAAKAYGMYAAEADIFALNGWTQMTNPVLSPSGWEDDSIIPNATIFLAGVMYMFYTGDESTAREIGVAMSTG